MKNIQKYIILFMAYLLLMSCDKEFLDNAPTDKYSDDVVWKDPKLVDLFLGDIYGNMPSIYDDVKSYLESSFTDESESSWTWHSAHKVNRMEYGADFPVKWKGFYATQIRQCNLAIANLHKSEFDEEYSNYAIAQARFLRALFNIHNYLNWGRFPIIDKPLTLEDDLAIPRGSTEECIDFIVADLDEAAKDLIIKANLNQSEYGRATPEACYALKARLLLNVHDYEGARDACEQVLTYNYTLFPDFSELFLPENDNNSEIIFDKQFSSYVSYNNHSFDDYELVSYFKNGGNGGKTCPTHNLVEAFEMSDGKLWNESPLYDPTHPYDNRDPRFYSTILADGAVYKGITVDLKLGTVFNLTNRRPTPTGYFLRKFLNPDYDYNLYDKVTNYQNSPIIRLAEIYLIYAESQYQLGETEVAREYVNKVRERAGMPDILTSDFTFESIKHERRVELAFEGERWNDARRWQEGAEIIGAEIYSVLIEDDEQGNRTYTKVLLEDRAWDDKMYWWPISQSEIEKYPEGVLEQNPGW
ncbi:RagB/SusD family nutrient uptake outer membrane protein [Marinifilum fragile]|uniref:RagB/SusD family nutrient uptake outer membrane protein n=1 Tax=Marinifilum fragile TaxID=570161 RepID=UPI002AAB8DCE|nr:RagB/SusD family nutrient uptake outer membrane protein [Marinifilum fragile]